MIIIGTIDKRSREHFKKDVQNAQNTTSLPFYGQSIIKEDFFMRKQVSFALALSMVMTSGMATVANAAADEDRKSVV